MENLLNFLKENSKNFLEQEIKKDRESCTYLFYGREGSYHLEVALNFASKFFCEENFYQKPHPSINILEPNNEEGIIKREDIKEIIRKASQSSFTKKKIFIINSIERMREDGWNTLLKTLEEPYNSIFILLSFSSKVPSTLLSRALSVDLTPRLTQIEDIELFEFFNGNLKNYVDFREEELSLDKLEIILLDKALENYLGKRNIKNKSILIKAVLEFLKNIKSYSKLDKILLAEKIEVIINKDKRLLNELLSLIIDKCSKIIIRDIEFYIFLKDCVYKNVNLSLILINFLTNLS